MAIAAHPDGNLNKSVFCGMFTFNPWKPLQRDPWSHMFVDHDSRLSTITNTAEFGVSTLFLISQF
jgi:hypothetical protein